MFNGANYHFEFNGANYHILFNGANYHIVFNGANYPIVFNRAYMCYYPRINGRYMHWEYSLNAVFATFYLPYPPKKHSKKLPLVPSPFFGSSVSCGGSASVGTLPPSLWSTEIEL